MPQWVIDGIDGKTGMEKHVSVEANTESFAREQAEAMGVKVGSVKQAGPQVLDYRGPDRTRYDVPESAKQPRSEDSLFLGLAYGVYVVLFAGSLFTFIMCATTGKYTESLVAVGFLVFLVAMRIESRLSDITKQLKSAQPSR